jgi:hypothetical protein
MHPETQRLIDDAKAEAARALAAKAEARRAADNAAEVAAADRWGALWNVIEGFLPASLRRHVSAERPAGFTASTTTHDLPIELPELAPIRLRFITNYPFGWVLDLGFNSAEGPWRVAFRFCGRWQWDGGDPPTRFADAAKALTVAAERYQVAA